MPDSREVDFVVRFLNQNSQPPQPGQVVEPGFPPTSAVTTVPPWGLRLRGSEPAHLYQPATIRSRIIRSRAVWPMSPKAFIANVSNTLAKMDGSFRTLRLSSQIGADNLPTARAIHNVHPPTVHPLIPFATLAWIPVPK